MPRPRKPASPFRYFNSSPEVIGLVVMMYVRFPLSLRNVEDLLFERGIDVCHETVRMWWNRFGPMFAGDIRRQRISRMRGFRHWRWHLDEMYVKLNGEMVYLWRAVDQEGEILESYITRTRDKEAALRFMKKALKRHGSPEAITTDGPLRDWVGFRVAKAGQLRIPDFPCRSGHFGKIDSGTDFENGFRYRFFSRHWAGLLASQRANC
jgi:putative transposase